MRVKLKLELSLRVFLTAHFSTAFLGKCFQLLCFEEMWREAIYCDFKGTENQNLRFFIGVWNLCEQHFYLE